ncbi:MAG TPA: tetratricopeptide repeat protein, partial [Trueperaceae bacterium]
ARANGADVSPELPTTNGAALGLQLTPFIGRDIELAEIAAALHDPSLRLLTLVGPGGAGKSRLARHVTQEQTAPFPGGAFFVPLAAADQMAPAIAATLGLNARTPAELISALADRPMLLVLDNLEHLMDGATLIAELLEGCPGLRILGTSREPLGFAGEMLLELGGLDYPERDDDPYPLVYDAVQMFVRGARRVHSGFVLTPGDHQAVARICRLLRGIPLALELATAWMRLLTPTELAGELTHNLDILESDRRDLPPRHRSLRAVFEHSWALLSPAERDGLTRLAVFRGSFDKAAAQRVGQLSLRTLLSLVNRSLVGRTKRGRFELHEAVRQYAAAKLATSPDTAEQTAREHAACYLELAETANAELTGPHQTRWLERLALDHANLRAAADWALQQSEPALGLRLANAQYWYWHIRGHYHESRELYDRLFALPNVKTHGSHYARALFCQGSAVSSLRDIAATRAVTRESLALYRELNDPIGTALALWQLGVAARDSGDLDEAGTLLDEAMRLQLETGDSFNLSTTYNDRAILASLCDQLDEAQAYFEKSLALKRKHSDKQGIAYALGNLAVLADERGEEPAVVRAALFDEMSLKRELGDRRGMTTSLINLAAVALRASDPDEACNYLLEGLELTEEIGDRFRGLILCATGAQLAIQRAQYTSAATLSAATLTLAERATINLPPGTISGLRASLQQAQGCLEPAAYHAAQRHGERMEYSDLIHAVRALARPKQPENA